MSSGLRKNKKESRKLKSLSALKLQRMLSGRSGAWFLEPSGDLHELEPRDCLKSNKSEIEERSLAIEDNNDEFERDRIGF